MRVEVNSYTFALRVGYLISVMTTLSAAADRHEDVPGKRHGIELELSRTFSSEFVRDLQSPDRVCAVRAALALGRTKNPRALRPLILRFERGTDPDVRAMAIYGVGLLSDSMRVPESPIIAALGDPSGIVRARAAVALAAFAPAPAPPLPQARMAGIAVAGAFAAESNDVVRWHEAWALGRAFPTAPSHAQIVSGLADRDDLVRMAFVDVAAKRRDPRLAVLIEPLRADRSWRVAEEAREGLRRIAGGSRTQHLLAIPAGVRTPLAPPPDMTPALPRPHGLGPARRPVAADADTAIDLQLRAAASLDGPAPGLHPRVRIGTTKGAIVVRLYPEWAPVTVANFLNLTDRGYYDGLRWFRIVPNFVVQTGDPTNTGDGDAGYTIPAEENPLEQRAGVISMGLNYHGNSPVRDSAGTQFYITLSPQFHLNRSFTVFGEIERGFDVLGRLIESDRMTRVERLPPD
jgi:peptidyl-prolyl cis-trans isomerase B (cyclophilin B)